ncbi:MAG TPA: hypothetical protein PLU53_02555 [Bacteroidia bacterium]|nr:hypothetical protein [Bacteroidia bacterium]
MKTTENFETGCCPRFNAEPWQEKEIIFKEKLFLKDHVTSIFHIPLNFGKVMEKNMELIEHAGAKSKEQIVLSEEKSPWRSDVHIAIDKEIPKAELEKISGTFFSKVFEGSYNEMGKFVEQMHSYVKSKGKEAKKLFFYYPYCPKCAKAYGKNYIVILAQQ